MNENKSIQKYFEKPLNQAINFATDISIKTAGILVDQFEDYSVPDLPEEVGYVTKKKELELALQKNPTNSLLHYRLGRVHHKFLELYSAKAEYEMADLLGKLTSTQQFYYQLVRYELGEIKDLGSIIDDSSVSLEIKHKYPEFFNTNSEGAEDSCK